jgi:predicted nucleic acid-binding protein
MKRVAVDANVFLRFLTRDDAGQHEAAERLLRAGAAGAVDLVCGPPVLFEVAWTLRRGYKAGRAETLDMLQAILALPGLRASDAGVAARAVEIARESGAEFADAYVLAGAEAAGADEVATFNVKDFRRMGAALRPMR